jgi:hypothetical protein
MSPTVKWGLALSIMEQTIVKQLLVLLCDN